METFDKRKSEARKELQHNQQAAKQHQGGGSSDQQYIKTLQQAQQRHGKRDDYTKNLQQEINFIRSNQHKNG